MKQYMVRAQHGEVEDKGGQISIGKGEYETFEQAMEVLNTVADFPMTDPGYKTIVIAQKNEKGTYVKGPFGINVIYQVTITHD